MSSKPETGRLKLLAGTPGRPVVLKMSKLVPPEVLCLLIALTDGVTRQDAKKERETNRTSGKFISK